MDKVSIYRQYLQELLTERVRLRNPSDPVTSETIFEPVNDRYQLVNVGWKDNNTRIYRCVLHADIINGKIWIQHDGTEEALADRLVDRGVPKQDIVIAYHAPNLRQYTEWAID
jgi:XisI protein